MGKVLVNETSLTGIGNAIRSKNGTTTTYKPSEMAAAISAIETGGGGGGTAWVEPYSKDVNFYDYDGTRLYSYTLAEASALTELPTPPEHDGLVFQGWNWSLEDINALDRKMNIGALYVTDDGATRLYITIDEGELPLDVLLKLRIYGETTVDWGDGSEAVSNTSNNADVDYTHTYQSAGNYVISITGNKYILRNNGSVLAVEVYPFGSLLLKKVEMGSGMVSFKGLRFNRLLKTVSVTKDAIMDDYLCECNSLQYITVPSINNTFDSCFYCNTSLKTVSLPNNNQMNLYSAFNKCMALESVTIPKDIVTECRYDAFNTCSSIRELDIPETVTKIYNRAFEGAYSLYKLIIRGGDTLTIDEPFNYANTNLEEYYFTSTTPPVLSSSHSLKINNECKIYVPAGCGDTYKNATNWTTYSNYIVEMEA